MIAVRSLLNNCPNVRSISMCVHGTDPFSSTLRYLADVCLTLHFSDPQVSDEFLHSIVEACIPLKSVSLSDSRGYSTHGLSSLLETTSLADNSVITLSQCLRDLVIIKLNFCDRLTNTSLFALIINYPFLQHVEMEHTRLRKEKDAFPNVDNHLQTKSSSIKSMNLGWNFHLGDECLSKITSVCPNLKQLDVSSCPGITRSVGFTLQNCHQIEQLSIRDCLGVENIGLKPVPLRLKELNMARSGVENIGLKTVPMV